MKHAAVCLVSVLVVCGCRTTKADTSQAKVDVNVGPGDSGQISSFVTKLRGFQANGGGQIAGDDIFGFFPLSDDEHATLAGARPDNGDVSCDGDICTISESGDKLQISLSQVSVPGLGSPTLWLDSTVTIKVRINGDSDLEICKATGIQVKKLFWVTFRGAHITPDQTTLDIGPGGSYPNC